MRLTCTVGEEMIHLLSSIAEKKGEVKARFLNQLEPLSREENKIDSVHATIFLQNRELGREITAEIIRNQSVRASWNSIKEVKNTMHIYQKLSSYNPLSQDSFKHAYQNLLKEKNVRAAYRDNYINYYYWTGFIGMSPPVEEMKTGMNELFHYLRHGKDPQLIKSCVCHYAIQFYQPFANENEKMSRLWQTLLLMKEHPSFEFLAWEKEILTAKKRYYSKLPGRDRNTDTSQFATYMLKIIDLALSNLMETSRKLIRPMDRIRYFYTLGFSSFTRKDYMRIHNNISTATASRDLEHGVDTGFFIQKGIRNRTTYQCHLPSE